ncbi:FAD-dependent monooxygenase [Streptomyces sp. enrichment culture]|uniref:FAD-dependent monooxygenase n=1 Tax=Streptomyces sp. enrichment culture TaxID=1795815 RepID=UPI003F573B3F
MPDSRRNSTLPSSTDVLIVGAGPTGLALAAALRVLGVDHVLIDRAAGTAVHSRAAAVHARTLESLATIGAADALVRLGRPGRSFTARDGERQVIRTPFDELDTPYPFVLAVPQQTTEEVLQARLEELGGRVYRRHTLLGLDELFPGMNALVSDDETGEVRAIQARYVVGCDGLHSTVRKQMDIPFPGHARPHNFALIEFTMEWDGPEGEITFFFSPAGLLAVSHLQGETYRIVALVDDDTPTPDAAAVQQLLDTRGPSAAGAKVKDISMASTWRVLHRIADTFSKGPVFLVGDAAHVHSPVGAQGMNTGLQDAFNLAWKLSAVIKGEAAPDLLLTYDAERRPMAQALLAFAAQLHDISTMSDPESIRLRNDVLTAVGQIPQAQMWLASRLAQLSVTYGGADGPKPAVGDRMAPRPGMAQGIGWSLVLPAGADTAAVEEAARLAPVPLAVTQDATLPHAVVVRPDGHVALTADASEAGELPARLGDWLRQPRSRTH